VEFKTYQTIEEYSNKVKSFLEVEEVVNNIPLSILRNMSASEDSLFALVEEHGEVLLVLLMTPPYNLYVYGAGPRLTEAITLAVKQLTSKNISLPGVIGPKDVAELFAKTWAQEHTVTLKIAMNQRIYQLIEVMDRGNSSGVLRVANENDISLLAGWVHEFSKVTAGILTEEESLVRAKRMVEQKTVYVWQDGEQVVSMVNKARPTENGITINFVYTPPNCRDRGYATSSVAAFSQLLLNEGLEYCTLYTDLTNPTSNSIYMKIGYKPIRDSVMYQFN
jgi:uncharacterized protein